MFMILWEYIVVESQRHAFEKIYGAEGDWAQLFRQSKEYLGTELLCDPKNPRRYVTIDRWTSSDAFDSFHEKYRLEYKALDVRCETLTERETQLGKYDLIFST